MRQPGSSEPARDGWQLAQINIGRLLALPGDERVAGFFGELDRINAIADSSAGFVWRLTGEGDNATDVLPTPDPRLIVNMSVWTDSGALFAFVYRSSHTGVMAQRKTWFERSSSAYQALWWVPANTIPSVEEGLSRLWLIDRFGPTGRAFTFKSVFPPPHLPGSAVDLRPDPWCQGRA